MKPSVPRVDLRTLRPAHAATRLLTMQFCQRHTVIPVRIAQGALVLAMADPEKRAPVVGEVRVLTGLNIDVVHASAEQIKEAIAASYGGAS